MASIIPENGPCMSKSSKYWLSKLKWMEKKVLQTNLKVYNNRWKSDRNSLSQFRSISTTGKGSADLSWCFISKCGSLWLQKGLAFVCSVHLSVILSQIKNVKAIWHTLYSKLLISENDNYKQFQRLCHILILLVWLAEVQVENQTLLGIWKHSELVLLTVIN